MPSFRDLSGKPVEDVAPSIGLPPAAPPLPADVDASVIRQRAEAVRKRREQGLPRPPAEDDDATATAFPGELEQPGETATPRVQRTSVQTNESSRLAPVPRSIQLPDDFETGLKNLEATLAQIAKNATRLVEGVELANHQIAMLRARAEKDVERLQKLDAIEKALK